MTGRWVACVTILVAAGVAAALRGQDTQAEAENERARLLFVVGRLDEDFAALARRPAASLRIRDAREWLAYFKERAGSWKPAKPEAGRALRLGLELDHHALRGLPEEPGAAGNIVNAVIDDIEVKGKHCQKKGLASLITVKVRTFRGPTEIGGLEIFYLPRLLAISPHPTPDRFPALSASEKELAPGRYVFWAGGGAQATISVGDGKSAMTVDLLAP